MSQVAIYTTPTCGYCKMAKAYFKEHNINYAEYDVTQDEIKAEEAVKKSGQMGVPVIEIDGKIIVGFDQPRLAELLHIQ